MMNLPLALFFWNTTGLISLSFSPLFLMRYALGPVRKSFNLLTQHFGGCIMRCVLQRGQMVQL